MAFMKKTQAGDKKGDVTWLIGVDEVGRGPLAGPVTVGAVAVKINGNVAQTYKNLRKKLMEISGKEYPMGVDSKKMKEVDRDFWYEAIKVCKRVTDSFYVSVQSSSALSIDQKGIAVCIADLVDLNIKKILKKIQKKEPNAELQNLRILLDGSLKTSLKVGNQKTIIKGDEKELLISLASVYAKVTRDTYMKNISKNSKYNQYGFEIHKGYGTVNHRRAISKYGISDEHRRSFCGRC
jgi:ribonuclease HII